MQFTIKRIGNCGAGHQFLQVTGNISANRTVAVQDIRERVVDKERFLMDALALHSEGKTNAQLLAEFDSATGWVFTV